MNILIKKWKEVEMEANTKMGGTWKVEIVHPNGGIEAPFGDKMRKNLILNSGINALAGNLTFGYQGASTISWGIYGSWILPALFTRAKLGSSSTAAVVTDSGLGAAITNQDTGTITQSCTTVNDTTSQAGPAFTKIYDFPAAASTINNINEAVIYGMGYGGHANNLSRFVFPTTITLVAGQFLRLTYSFKAYIDALLNPISVSLGASNGFNVTGQLKLVGTYQNIFGGMGSNGNLTYPSAYYPCGGWLLNGRRLYNGYNSSYPTGTNAQMIPTGVNFPSINSDLTGYSKVGSTITQDTAGMVFGSYSSGSGQQDITYLFAAANPISTTNIGGIIFSSSGYAPANLPSGWYLKFDNDQSKNASYSLAVNLRQSITAI
jgi:hypothetical protein